MIEIKPLINKGHTEIMVDRSDIITLLQYVEIPDFDHACEHERLIETISRLAKDFEIDIDDYVRDNSLVEQVQFYDNWEKCVERAWQG